MKAKRKPRSNRVASDDLLGGKIQCPTCGASVRLMKNGAIPKHQLGGNGMAHHRRKSGPKWMNVNLCDASGWIPPNNKTGLFY